MNSVQVPTILAHRVSLPCENFSIQSTDSSYRMKLEIWPLCAARCTRVDSFPSFLVNSTAL